MSSDPPLHSILQNAWKYIALPKSQQIERELPISSPTSITRVRSLTVELPPVNHDSHHIPRYANATEIEKREDLPKGRRSSLSEITLTLAFQAFFAMYQPMSGSREPPRFFGPAMVIAAAASLSAMCIENSYPQIAAIAETMGLLSLTLGFFAMAAVFFSGSLIMLVIARLACASTIVAIVRGCATPKRSN